MSFAYQIRPEARTISVQFDSVEYAEIASQAQALGVSVREYAKAAIRRQAATDQQTKEARG